MSEIKSNDYFKGRGAQYNTHNPFLKRQYVAEHLEGIDEEHLEDSKTEFLSEYPKNIVNKVPSPDVPMDLSINPYQGCEHGCIYCYARDTHQYWGYSAGLDFERKIIIKENVVELLQKRLEHPSWQVKPIMLSGNTDCYQPIERKKELTRSILKLMDEYRHPVGIITKNSLILRDLDLLTSLHEDRLISVNVSITTLDEKLRGLLEPRTASAKKRFQAVEALAKVGIPVNVMMAPIIPGLTSHEIPELLKAAADAGATSAGFTMLRLNGSVAPLFEDWIKTNLPDRAAKVLHHTANVHGGSVADQRFKTRMKGEGNIAESIRQLFSISKKRYGLNHRLPTLNCDAFVPRKGKQLGLF